MISCAHSAIGEMCALSIAGALVLFGPSIPIVLVLGCIFGERMLRAPSTAE
jgi:hypothetical protein